MSKNTRNRILLTAVAALLLVVMTVGGTLAYLTATTSNVVNEFKAAGIDATLTETESDWDMQLIPGTSKAKDPTVTVTTSVDAWVFIKFDTNVAEGTNTLTYDFLLNNNGTDEYGCTWVQGDGTNIPANVWYTDDVKASETTYEWELLVGNIVSVPAAAVGTDVDEDFTMTFDVAAVQLKKDDNNNFTAKEAYDQIAATFAD